MQGLTSFKWIQCACYGVENLKFLEHFLLRCESLTQVRQPLLDKIYQSFQNRVCVGHFNSIRLNDTELTATIRDCTTLIDDVWEAVLDTFLHEIESTARGLGFTLHLKLTR